MTTHLDAPDVAPARAMQAARDHLLDLQHEQGWWKGELQTNVTMDAEDLLLRQFLGVRDESDTAACARWIRSQQRDDGTWALYHGGPGDLSTTVEAYVALKLAGDSPDAAHMARARAFVLAEGGVEASRVFTRIWLALFGEWSWDELPAMPPELVLLPSWVPLNVYDWACWARQTVVPLTVVCALRPSRDLGVSVAELRSGRVPRRPRDPLWSWPTAFRALDRVLHRYQRRPVRRLREHAMRRAAEWIIARPAMDALSDAGLPADHPALRRAADFVLA